MCRKKKYEKEYFKVFGNGDWLDLGLVRFNIYNKNTLRVAFRELKLSDIETLDLKNEVISSKRLIEIMFGAAIIDISDNGIGRGGDSIDIRFDRDL